MKKLNYYFLDNEDSSLSKKEHFGEKKSWTDLIQGAVMFKPDNDNWCYLCLGVNDYSLFGKLLKLLKFGIDKQTYFYFDFDIDNIYSDIENLKLKLELLYYNKYNNQNNKGVQFYFTRVKKTIFENTDNYEFYLYGTFDKDLDLPLEASEYDVTQRDMTILYYMFPNDREDLYVTDCNYGCNKHGGCTITKRLLSKTGGYESKNNNININKTINLFKKASELNEVHKPFNDCGSSRNNWTIDKNITELYQDEFDFIDKIKKTSIEYQRVALYNKILNNNIHFSDEKLKVHVETNSDNFNSLQAQESTSPAQESTSTAQESTSTAQESTSPEQESTSP